LAEKLLLTQKGIQMLTVIKKMLSVLLIVFIATCPMACLDFNSDNPDREPSHESSRDVNVGGEHGVTVEH
jgi:hypothetical protein